MVRIPPLSPPGGGAALAKPPFANQLTRQLRHSPQPCPEGEREDGDAGIRDAHAVVPTRVRKLLLILISAMSISANDVSYRSLQSGSPTGPTPLHDRGILGQGQLIAILDTGADYTTCYLSEPDGSRPPFNSGSPAGGLDWQNIDLSRRKIVAYNYLYSCDQYPGAPGCERVGAAGSFDNTRHGTFAASIAAGDRDTPLAHDFADSIAPGAKLVIQDGGYIGGDLCTQRPGFGCPPVLTPILEQAWRQGVRIHSNSWGDLQGKYPGGPTANYPQAAYDIDAFVYTHPDLLVVFNTGNKGGSGTTPLSSLSAPGSAKNTLQIGGTRRRGDDDDVLHADTLFGPTRDGRIKPDLVGPAYVVAGDADQDGNPATCDTSRQPGTSWSAPSIAGAAALVRQYYTDGFFPSGVADPSHAMSPSAALLKATLISAARAVPRRHIKSSSYQPALPVPSHEQGWGFPVLDDALYFSGDARRLHVVDVPLEQGLAAGESTTVRVSVRPGTPLRAVLVWTDPPGTVRAETDPTPQLVNDLDLRIAGVETVPDRLNNVEVVNVLEPEARTYSITVSAHHLGFGERQGYALVVTGDFEEAAPPRTRAVRSR